MTTYCYKLYPTKNNKFLEQSCDIACEIWNHCIALERRYYRLWKKHLSDRKLKSHIAKLKKLERYQHWSNLNAQAVQDVVERIDRSYKAFYRNIRSKKRRAFPPGFRKGKDYQSFTLKQAGYKIDGNSIRIMGKKYKFFKSREIEGIVKTLTIKKSRTGEWFVFATTTHDIRQNCVRTGKAVGIDFGLKTFLTTSDGEKIQAPEPLKRSISQVAVLTASFSRKSEGSRNREKVRKRLAKQHSHIANQRRDFAFKLAGELCSRYDIIGIEDLDLLGIRKKWGRKEEDLAYGELVKILQYMAQKTGKEVRKVSRWMPSTKTCSACGHIESVALSDREWLCPICGTQHDRDINAAINIKNEVCLREGVPSCC